jgi:hypothetical protein
MLNLLNREKRYYLRREYLGRLSNVFLGILIFCLVFYLILMVSNNFLVSFEKIAVENETNSLSKSSFQKELDDYEKSIKHLQNEYNIFSKNIVNPTEVIFILKTKEMPGINLTAISFQKTEEGLVKLEIKGISKNRDTLVNYVNNLKTTSLFKDVNVPISSLAKSIDIPFSISTSAKIDIKQ